MPDDGRGAPAKPTNKSDTKTTSLSYSSYLKIAELIELQKPLSEPQAHDELLFIVTHQAYELWFKQVLFELDSVVEALAHLRMVESIRLMERVREIFKLLIQQVDILETMSPSDFNRFRSVLNPASGFQSAQFRELELLAGADFEDYQKFDALMPEWKDKIHGRAAGPTLRHAFLSLLQQKGLLKDYDTASIHAALLKVYENPSEHSEVHHFLEQLINFDELILLWRFRHIQMVERMIGMRPGTGGSLGVPYLQQTLKKRFFPELWEIRTHLGQGYGARP